MSWYLKCDPGERLFWPPKGLWLTGWEPMLYYMTLLLLLLLYYEHIYTYTYAHKRIYTTCFPWGHFLCPYRFILNNISPRKLFMSRQPNVPICHFELRHFLIPYWQLISWAHSAVTGSLFSSSCWLPMLTFTYVFVTAQERKWSMTHVTHDLSPKS